MRETYVELQFQAYSPAPAAESVANVLAEWNAIYDAYNAVACLMLDKQAGVERFDLIQTFHACKQEKGKPVAAYVLKMKGYVEQLERLGYMLPQDLIIGLILKGLTIDFAGFMRNYNMHNMGKTIGELHAMLIEYEKSSPKKAETPQVMAIRSDKIQKANKKSLKAKGKGKANGKEKDKQVYICKPKNPKPTAKEHPAKDDICHYCKEGLRGSRNLEQGALYLYVGNGVRAQVEAIKSFDLGLPNGLVIYLDNCHYKPTITRGVVSIHCLVENGFVRRFTDYGISVSKNNVLYFNAIPRDGIYEIDMHNLVPNLNSIYNVSNKRAKNNSDSTYLWHCRLAHISKKRIEKLQHEVILKSTDDESFYQCVSCLLGKMTRKPFPHRTERATDLLGIIHTDVCGLLRHVSRQESATRILNMVPTKKVDKTPYELWYGKVPNLSYLKVWGCEALVKRDTPDKLQQRSVKCIFIGYPKETMGYYFYFPPENKIVVARYAEFFEKNLITQEVSGRAIDLEEIQDEDTSPSEITSEIPMEVEGFEPPQEEVIPIRRSERTHRAPERLCLNVEVEEHSLGDLNEPTSYKAASIRPQAHTPTS
ncbi:retrotransposon protein, putative, ty1-copia subclass [Tanacetum coccineum]